MKNISKRKLREGYKEIESKPTTGEKIVTKSKAGVEYIKFKEVISK